MAIITISRGTFSGGRTLAECIANRLGYECIGREVVLKAATTYGISVEKLSEEFEQPPSFWKRLYGYRARYMKYVRAALLEHAREGNLVYHGHAGHLLLPGVSHLLRVRVIADMEYRIRAAMNRQHLSRDGAIAFIDKMDQKRLMWAQFLYGIDWRDPSLYDVVLNLNHISISDACETLARMVELESLKPTAQSMKVMENLALGSRVWATLASNPTTAAADLEVVADDGVVSVTGLTHYPSVVDSVQSVAGRVEGVREIRCQMKETSKTYP